MRLWPERSIHEALKLMTRKRHKKSLETREMEANTGYGEWEWGLIFRVKAERGSVR